MIRGRILNILKLAKIDIDYTLELNLSKLLNKSISSKNIQKWVEKNSTHLKNFITNRGMYLAPGFIRYSTDLKHDDKPVWAMINNNPKIFSNYDIITSSLLSGEGDIPNLWLHVGTLDSSSLDAVVSPELAHDDFILTAISVIFHEVGDNLVKGAETFYANNKEKINKIKKSFKERPKKLGSGADGAAFSISPDMVLKIFKDDVSYLKARESFQRLHQFPELAKTEAMIYDIGILGEYQGVPLYYYIMEKMKPLSSLDDNVSLKIREIAAAIGNYIFMRSKEGKLLDIKKNIEKHLATKNSREELLKTIKEMNKFIERFIRLKFGNSLKDIEGSLGNALNPNWLSSLIEEITFKYLTGRGDLHTNNLGLTNYGVFRYFDSAWHGWQQRLNLGDKYKYNKDQL